MITASTSERGPNEELKQIEAAWLQVVEEESAGDAQFKKIADSYFGFRERYRIWGDSQSLMPTYQDDPAPSSPHSLPLVMAADNTMNQQGFVRIINRSDQAGEVSIQAIDDDGGRRGPVSLTLAARQTRQFNSQELEAGNSEKGLSGGVGNGTGNWRLELDTDLNIKPLAYVRTTHDGFLTSIHQVAVETEGGSMRYGRAVLHPWKECQPTKQAPPDHHRGRERLDFDQRTGRFRQRVVREREPCSLDARAAVTLTAKELEEGGEDFMGSLEAGSGKWQLTVSADRPVDVLSLMFTPTDTSPIFRSDGGSLGDLRLLRGLIKVVSSLA